MINPCKEVNINFEEVGIGFKANASKSLTGSFTIELNCRIFPDDVKELLNQHASNLC